MLLALVALTCLAGVALAPAASAAMIPCADEFRGNPADLTSCTSEATDRSVQWAEGKLGDVEP